MVEVKVTNPDEDEAMHSEEEKQWSSPLGDLAAIPKRWKALFEKMIKILF